MSDPSDTFIARLMRGEVPQHPIGATLGRTLLVLDVQAGRLEAEYLGTAAFLRPAAPGPIRPVAIATAPCKLVPETPR